MKTLRAQLTTRLVIVGTLLLAGAGLALHWQMAHALGDEFDSGLRATLQSLTTLTEQEHDGKIGIELASENAPQFQERRGPDVFLLRGVDGHEIQRSASLGDRALPPIAGTPARPGWSDAKLADGRTFRLAGACFFPAIEDEQRFSVTKVMLVVGRDRAALDRSLGMLRAALFVIGVAALFVLGGATSWGVASGLAPVRCLRDEVRSMDEGSLGAKFEVGTLPAELQPVAASMNDLVARLHAAIERERRFTAAAAHELRTPIAELRVLAEVNLKTTATEAEQAESWRDALATTRRMERLAVQLLDLTRAGSVADATRVVPVDVAEAVREAWKQNEGCASARGVKAELAFEGMLSVQSDPVLLGIVLGNICGNAAEHAPEGARFRVVGKGDAESVSVRFCNCADGITAGDVPHLFERFWRKDAACTDARHHGLGLALAKEFTALLGGELEARLQAVPEAAAQEIEFTLTLPRTR